MQADVVHTFLSHDPAVWLTTISGMAATWLTLYFVVIRPRAQEHKKHQADRDLALKAEEQRMSARWLIIDGWAAVPGVYDGGDPLALRLRAMEADLAELKARK
jgi:hypothetical protein